MPRKKKEGKITNFYLSIESLELLERYCEETGLPKTTAVERFIIKEVGEYEKTKVRNDTLQDDC